MLIIALPLLVAALGAILYFAATQNAKVAELGRILFAVGALVTLWLAAMHVIKI